MTTVFTNSSLLQELLNEVPSHNKCMPETGSRINDSMEADWSKICLRVSASERGFCVDVCRFGEGSVMNASPIVN